MTHRTTILAIALPLALLGAGGCDRDSEKAVEEIGESVSQQRDELVEKSKRRLEQLDSKLSKLEQEHGDEAAAAADQALAKLREARDEAAKRIEQLQGASGETWDELKARSERAMSEAESAYNDALEKLQTE